MDDSSYRCTEDSEGSIRGGQVADIKGLGIIVKNAFFQSQGGGGKLRDVDRT